jgi:hypothetical protein
MGLPINRSSIFVLKDYGLQLLFLCGSERIYVHKLSPDKKAHHIEETIIEIDEYRPLNMEFLDWNSNRQLIVKLPMNTENSKEKLRAFHYSKYNAFQTIFNPSIDEVYPWSCGVFLYEVVFEGLTFYGAIRVKPKNLSSTQYVHMHEFLEKELKGLTLDFQRNALQYRKQRIDHQQLRLMSWLNDRFSTMMSALGWIESDSGGRIARHYQVEHKPGHLDQRSMRWRNSFKGAVLGDRAFYNRKHFVDVNLPHNQFVKHQVKQILQAIVNLEKELEKLHDTREQLLSVTKCKQMLQYKLEQPFWASIDDIHPRNPQRYMQKGFIVLKNIWNEFHEQINGGFYKSNERISSIPLFQSTAKIYEYYSYILIIKQLIKSGFSLQSDSLSKQLEAGFIDSELQAGTTVILETDDLQVRVVYDEEVEKRSQEAIKKQTFFFSKFRKRKPDIRVDLYKKREQSSPIRASTIAGVQDASSALDSNFVYMSSIVFEVKYRPLSNIYSEDGQTGAMDQMNEYIGIKYYCPIRKDYFNRIREVVCIYPGHTSMPICLNTEAGKFIQLYPQDEEMIVGELEIEQLLKGWIFDDI